MKAKIAAEIPKFVLRAALPPSIAILQTAPELTVARLCSMPERLSPPTYERLRFEVAAISRGIDTAELARKLGAHHYIDSSASDPAAALQALGGAKVILITASGGKTVAETFKGLRPGGVSIVLGVGPEPIEVSAMDLIFGSRKLEGALTGDPATGDETLRFSALSGVSAMIETVPLEKAADAYAKMMAGKARFRMVLTMD